METAQSTETTLRFDPIDTERVIKNPRGGMENRIAEEAIEEAEDNDEPELAEEIRNYRNAVDGLTN